MHDKSRDRQIGFMSHDDELLHSIDDQRTEPKEQEGGRRPQSEIVSPPCFNESLGVHYVLSKVLS
jgi:hypothetical protein